jgi:hypothetical protein
MKYICVELWLDPPPYAWLLPTSRKKGFHSPLLVPNVFGPWLKGPSVPVRLKMWARGISPSSNGPFGPGFSHQPGLMPLGLLSRLVTRTGTKGYPLVPV